MRRLLNRFIAGRSGATSIEYALIAVGISLAIIVAVQNIGPATNAKFTSINSSLK